MNHSRLVSCTVIVGVLLTSGCAGRRANPIPLYVPGDEQRSCAALKAEIAQLDADMIRIIPDTDKFAYNAAMFAGGILLIVPFFLMDLEESEKIEWEAMRVRRNRLVGYAVEKNCYAGETAPEMIMSIEQMKKLSKEQRKKGAQHVD